MSSHESLEFNESVEGAVEFNKETRCALKRGFEKNPAVLKQLEEAVGEMNIKLFAGLLSDPDEMKLIPSDDMKTVFSQIAKRELERIEAEHENSDDLSCGHLIDEHWEALQEVIDNMEPLIH